MFLKKESLPFKKKKITKKKISDFLENALSRNINKNSL